MGSCRRAVQDIAPDKSQLKVVHATIKKVTEDIETLSFNTAISQMMIFVNAFTNAPNEFRYLRCARCWSCSIPSRRISLRSCGKHWATKFAVDARRHHRATLAGVMTKRFLVEDEVEIVVQVNGKVRDRFTRRDSMQMRRTLKAAALALPKMRSCSPAKKFARS